MREIENPFAIVKANDFSDEEIHRYWVDIVGDDGVLQLAKPKIAMPMIIKGGKGSGKTHLMRYLSYELQKIRHADVRRGIADDGYLGIYHRCGSLNPSRFSNSGVAEDAWDRVFAYYFEIWIVQILVRNVIDFISVNNLEVEESRIAHAISELFDTPKVRQFGSLDAVFTSLRSTQKEIDNAINNLPFTQSFKPNIDASPGQLIFGVPRILGRVIAELEGVRFLYLIDELENLTPSQQIFINSLIRDRQDPCSIRVGVRSYGMKTYATLADGEPNKPNSEFEEIELDRELRKLDRYEQFATRLCVARLVKSDRAFQHISEETLASFFENPKDQNQLLADFVETGPDSRCIDDFVGKLKSNPPSSDILPNSDFASVSDSLRRDGHPLVEAASVMAMFRAWSSRESLIGRSNEIQLDGDVYLSRPKDSRVIEPILSHYKTDLIARLIRLHRKSRHTVAGLTGYVGFPAILAMSKGFPRHLLTICKHIYQSAVFNNEHPLVEGQVTALSQFEGILQASDWFIEDAKRPGTEGRAARIIVDRIAELFRISRFADTPKECSVISFSTNFSKCTERTRNLILDIERASFILRDPGGRKDRNSERVDEQFKLNPLLCPHWELPVASRGELSIHHKDLDTICDIENTQAFESFKRKFELSCNAPFAEPSTVEQKDFFD